ncbi:molybdate ABC transporter substrate-binding protein [Coleofasciculus sp. FACHB-1120]|uniref:molybdate ABC transporter substrate-binding protein n=1 Tax=Coleofasciculus sp. FACHB-1120 TaxID=2692783 RepID=UPI001F551768|nr:molybdate ABC transporter substrate-binding protein [Coleofasciculus sp. FACHB-1120]
MSLLLGACTAPALSPKASESTSTTLTVAAAASLSEAFTEIATSFQAQLPTTVNFNFAASGFLQKQIERGAPIDVFASAAARPMDALETQNLLLPQTRKTFGRNQLVLVAMTAQTPWLKKLSDLSNSRLKRLAIGNPATVPAGEYAKMALEKENLYTKLEKEKKLVFGDNVRQVLTYVEQGNVDAALVYATDAAISKTVKVISRISLESTQPISYWIAVVKQSQNSQQAKEFINFVTSYKGQQILQKYGFLPISFLPISAYSLSCSPSRNSLLDAVRFNPVSAPPREPTSAASLKCWGGSRELFPL